MTKLCSIRRLWSQWYFQRSRGEHGNHHGVSMASMKLLLIAFFTNSSLEIHPSPSPSIELLISWTHATILEKLGIHISNLPVHVFLHLWHLEEPGDQVHDFYHRNAEKYWESSKPTKCGDPGSRNNRKIGLHRKNKKRADVGYFQQFRLYKVLCMSPRWPWCHCMHAKCMAACALSAAHHSCVTRTCHTPASQDIFQDRKVCQFCGVYLFLFLYFCLVLCIAAVIGAKSLPDILCFLPI